jgi:ElaB/YqjD/DUF883 family membrane-anchored ribosome-binding protein
MAQQAAAQRRLESLRKEFENLREEMSKTMKNSKGAGLDDARAKLWESARDIEKKTEDALTDLYGSVQKQGRDAWVKGREQVRRHPVAAIVGALTVGLVLGKITQRR